jgi:hypothetical protein
MASLQETTDDLVLQLNSLQLTVDDLNLLAQALRMSDLVKFAKYTTSAEDDRKAFEDIRNTIIRIEEMEAKVLPSGKI